MLHSAKKYNAAREVTYYKKKQADNFFSCVPVSQMTCETDDIIVITITYQIIINIYTYRFFNTLISVYINSSYCSLCIY